MSAIYDNNVKHSDTIWLEHNYPEHTEGCDWQVIFITADNLDYQRSQCLPHEPLEEVIAWADKMIERHPHLARAKIERF